MRATDTGPGVPGADECLPYYQRYISLVPDGHVVDVLERQIHDTAGYLATLTAEQAVRREAPKEWNAVEIVGHLADTERVFGFRALVIGRGDPLMWNNVEFEQYQVAAGFSSRSLADVAAELATVRGSFVSLLRGLDEAAWDRRAPEGWTLRSVRAVAYTMAGHELHHMADIRRQMAAS